jgi:hypothetical protein
MVAPLQRYHQTEQSHLLGRYLELLVKTLKQKWQKNKQQKQPLQMELGY